MKRLLAFLVVLVVGIVAGRLSEQAPVSAEGRGAGEPPAMPCADLNADGRADISDAVYLLSCLFMGGDCPKCPPRNGQPVGLPDTGQATCYDAEGNEVLCDNDTCPGQDGFYETACSVEGRFVDNGDGTVTDNCTGLMWQKDTADTNGDGQIDGDDRLPWCDGLAYCQNLTFAGHDDWRLPNIRELESIVDYGRSGPATDPVFGAVSSFHWSSSSRQDVPYQAWLVVFHIGNVILATKDVVDGFVLAVRTIQPGE
jgi:hypothetical protein